MEVARRHFSWWPWLHLCVSPVISAIKTRQTFYLKLIKQHFINVDNMNRNQRQHNAESNLRQQNPESREPLHVMRIQCDALAMYSLPIYNPPLWGWVITCLRVFLAIFLMWKERVLYHILKRLWMLVMKKMLFFKHWSLERHLTNVSSLPYANSNNPKSRACKLPDVQGIPNKVC